MIDYYVDEYGRRIDPPVVLPAPSARMIHAYRGGRPRAKKWPLAEVGESQNGRTVVRLIFPIKHYQEVIAQCDHCGDRRKVRVMNMRKHPCRCGGYRQHPR